MNAKYHLPPLVTCPACHQPNELDAAFAEKHFRGETFSCIRCGATSDRYVVARKAIEDLNPLGFAMGFIGARSTYFEVRLEPGQRAVYRYSEHDIPVGARILFVNYTSRQADDAGGFFHATEIHGNSPTRGARGDHVVLWPVPSGKNPGPGNDVGVFVTWVPPTDDAETWRQLVDAFASYANEDYAGAIVPANIAVEVAVSRFLATCLAEFAAEGRVSDFLQKGATYSHQLNVLMPMVARLAGCPRLSQHIAGQLNALRKLRNDLAHRGTTAQPTDRPRAADLLASALFGFRYVQFVENAWVERRSGPLG